MAMAPKENITDHTVWTSVYFDALVSDGLYCSRVVCLEVVFLAGFIIEVGDHFAISY